MNEVMRLFVRSKALLDKSQATRTVSLGMPQLAFNSLSENWLLKELGDQHWSLLAIKLGLPDAKFRDTQGNRLYAAFTAVRISEAQFTGVTEGDKLTMSSSLSRISGTQYLSTHLLTCENRPVAKVTMISVFLMRTVENSNRHVQRATAVAALTPPVDATSSGFGLAETARRMRAGRWDTHLGFRQEAASELASFSFHPCPQSDFNGADFLYFASFQSIVDRAEWDWDLSANPRAHTRYREIFYYGNIDLGDRLRVVLAATYPKAGTDQEVYSWCRVFREYDRKLIADVFTIRHSV